ncbi:MAG: NYN domain-containing protein [Kiritimatiellia bacterium]
MKDWLIIDGYNLLCRIFPKTLGAGAAIIARNRKNMLALIEPLVNLLAAKITIVYDGAAVEPRPGERESEIIEVVYTPPNISADSYIENLVWKAARPENILVVTSDRMERDGAGAGGAETMAASLFMEKIATEQARLSSRMDKHNKTQKGPTLGDFFDISGHKSTPDPA